MSPEQSPSNKRKAIMEIIQWNSKLETGIDVIDQQHKRIVDYINALRIAQGKGDRGAVAKTIDDVIDYTQSHFGFEEALMEDAGYALLNAHKRVHELFIRRVGVLHQRFKDGEDIAPDLHNVLARWLITHIQTEDRDYVGSVKTKMVGVVADQNRRKSLLARFFGI